MTRSNTSRTPSINYTMLAWLIVSHAGALFALLSINTQNVLVFLGLLFIIHCLGFEIGFHRLLCHQSFKASPGMLRLLATLGTLGFFSPPIHFVALHLYHHTHSDKPKDPHNAAEGYWNAHYLWIILRHNDYRSEEFVRSRIQELERDPYLRWLNQRYVMLGLQALLAICLFVLGSWEFVIWGIFVRMAVGNELGFLLNSHGHFFGYRNYETRDNSKNCWWLALLTWGQGWHNNHHAFPRSAKVGHKWWEIDFAYYIIRVCSKLKLVSDVRVPNWSASARASARQTSQ